MHNTTAIESCHLIIYFSCYNIPPPLTCSGSNNSSSNTVLRELQSATPASMNGRRHVTVSFADNRKRSGVEFSKRDITSISFPFTTAR
mmetsp:Transcript_49387/g.57733  ORF Transcript_49387/g.57733 Transcript_49387/m.57733 type:complete len:88 (+) Transcript_49387:62-325(+)